MIIESVVEMLVNYFTRQRRAAGDAEIVGDPVIDDLARTIQAQLEQNTGYATLWEEFERDPVRMAPELMGALEMVVEGLPQLRVRLEEYVAEWDRQHKETDPSIQGDDVLINPDEDEVPGASINVPDQVDDFYDGTYLYGTSNTRRGTESEGREIGLQEGEDDDVAGDMENLGMHIERLPGTFTRIVTAVDDHPELDEDDKEIIKGHLDAIETQVALEEDGDFDLVRHHLFRIKGISSDISDALMADENFQNFIERRNEPGYLEDMD
jgi:hypothetical protein